MDYIAYKNFLDESIKKHHYLRRGEFSAKLIKEWADYFEMPIDNTIFLHFNRHNKEELENLGKKIKLHLFLQNNTQLFSKDIIGKFPIREIVEQKTFIRADWCFMIYLAFVNHKIGLAFIAQLPEAIKELWEKLVWTKSLSAEQVEAITNVNPVIKIPDARTTKSVVHQDYLGFAVESRSNYYNEDSIFYFLLPAIVRQMQQAYVAVPKESVLKPIASVSEQYTIFNAESVALQDIPRVLAYHSQGNIKILSTGRPNAATGNKMRKTVALEEFYAGDKELEALRSHFLAHWIVYVPMKQISIGSPVVEIVKALHERLQLNHISPFAASITQLKGFTHLNQYLTINNQWYEKVFNQIESNQWYSIKNLRDNVRFQDVNYQPASATEARNYLTYKGKGINYSGQEYDVDISVKGDNYQKMVLDNYVNGFVFMLATLGAVDIAYTKPDTTTFGETFFSDFEGLYAFRLNALGAYLLGKNKSYEAPIKEDATNLVFDENELIILGKAEDKLTDTLLLNYVQKAGANRYIVTAQSFLKDCKNPKQIKDKIALFKQTVGVKKLPDNWEDFFKILQERAENIKIASDSYEVFELNKEDKELIRLIAQDKDFQKIVVKAEGFKVLIPKPKMAAFRSKLREYGYLLK